MTNVNHELSTAELGMVSGGGLKSAFEKAPAPTATSGSGTGAPGWWNPPAGYLNWDSIRALSPIQF